MKIAVVTAVFGNTDDVLVPAKQDTHHQVDFLIFGKDAEGWQRRDADFGKHVPDVYKARAVKTCPHMFLDGYDAFIWIDGCVQIAGQQFVNSLVDLLGERQVGFYHCNTNKTLAEHVKTIINMPLFCVLPLKEQVAAYEKLGYKDTVLYETGVHIKRRSTQVAAMCNEWLSHLFIWSYRDQFALPYLLWKHGIEPAILGPTVWSTENHKHHGHTSEYAAVRHSSAHGTCSWSPGDNPDALHPAHVYEEPVPADSGG